MGEHEEDETFVGNVDTKHSKLPLFIRLRGSILPKMLLPLLFASLWATAITCISKFIWPLGLDSVLLTVLGFVVGLSLSFRSSTAYERYAEGRRYWAQMILASRNLSRIVWIHIEERNGGLAKQDLVEKLTCINLILAYAVATKYRLRRQIGYTFPDLYPLIQNLPTLTEPSEDDTLSERKLLRLSQALGLPGSGSERRMMKNVSNYGLNVPLEILTYFSAYIDKCHKNGTLKDPVLAHVLESVMSLLQCLTGMERVLGTPLPLAYNVAISHITWTYILILPFQLYNPLGWITIPGTLAAAYIILGLAVIGKSIENPFGTEAGHLNMEGYIRSLAVELDVLTSSPPPSVEKFIKTDRNYPLRHAPGTNYFSVQEMSLQEIRRSLKGQVGARSEIETEQKKGPKESRTEEV